MNEEHGENLHIIIGVKNHEHIMTISLAFQEMIDYSNNTGMRDIGFFDNTYKLFTNKSLKNCAVNYH